MNMIDADDHLKDQAITGIERRYCLERSRHPVAADQPHENGDHSQYQ